MTVQDPCGKVIERLEAERNDLNDELDSAQAVIDAAQRRIGYLGHTPVPGEPDYLTYAALAAHLSRYPPKGEA